MSEPRHSLIWKDAERGMWWLTIVRWDTYGDEGTDLSDSADTIGGFDSDKDAIDYLKHYQNVGYETPVLDADIHMFNAHPRKWIDKNDDPYSEDYVYYYDEDYRLPIKPK